MKLNFSMIWSVVHLVINPGYFGAFILPLRPHKTSDQHPLNARFKCPKLKQIDCIVLYYLLLNMSGARRIKANYALVIFYTERLHESSTFVCLLRVVKKNKKDLRNPNRGKWTYKICFLDKNIYSMEYNCSRPTREISLAWNEASGLLFANIDRPIRSPFHSWRVKNQFMLSTPFHWLVFFISLGCSV